MRLALKMSLPAEGEIACCAKLLLLTLAKTDDSADEFVIQLGATPNQAGKRAAFIGWNGDTTCPEPIRQGHLRADGGISSRLPMLCGDTLTISQTYF